MILPYPLPPKIPATFLWAGLPDGYAIRRDQFDINYLIYGSEDLLGLWSIREAGRGLIEEIRREVVELVAQHMERRVGLQNF